MRFEVALTRTRNQMRLPTCVATRDTMHNLFIKLILPMQSALYDSMLWNTNLFEMLKYCRVTL